MAPTRSGLLGPAARVVVPDDVDDPGVRKASGRVTPPHHVRWSAPVVRYDLDDRAGRVPVYEQVLQEGADEDVRDFIPVMARRWHGPLRRASSTP